MVFKPFKPPLIRKPSSSDTRPDSSCSNEPPVKKQRLQKDGDNTSVASVQEQREPLLQVKNPSDANGGTNGNTGTDEKYYNVLWSVHTDPLPYMPNWMTGASPPPRNTRPGMEMGFSVLMVLIFIYEMSPGGIWDARRITRDLNWDQCSRLVGKRSKLIPRYQERSICLVGYS